MATFDDDVQIIRTAVYGKEMRPAIADALLKSWASVESMMTEVDELNKRVNNLSGGGGGDDPSGPTTNSYYLVDEDATIMVEGRITPISAAAIADTL